MSKSPAVTRRKGKQKLTAASKRRVHSIFPTVDTKDYVFAIEQGLKPWAAVEKAMRLAKQFKRQVVAVVPSSYSSTEHFHAYRWNAVVEFLQGRLRVVGEKDPSPHSTLVLKFK